MTRFWFSRCVAVSVAAFLAIGSSGGRAADNDEERLIRSGLESRRTGNDAAALELFRKAYDLQHSPRAAAQMGLAEVALGRWVDANDHLEEATANARDPWIAKHNGTLLESLRRASQHVGRLEILGGPSGAQITIEGAVVATLPLSKPLRVRSGECRFVVAQAGYEPTSRKVDVTAGELTRETVNLSKQSSAGSSAVAHAFPGTDGDRSSESQPESPSATARAAQFDSTSSPARGDPGGSRWKTAGIAMGAAGVVGVAAGVFCGVKARDSGQQATNSAVFDPNADSTGHRYQTLQYVGYGIGGALLAAGIAAYLFGASQDNPTGPVNVAVVPEAGGAWASVFGRF